MSQEEQSARPVVTPPLPRAIWVVALSSLAGQVLVLVRAGIRDDDQTSLAVSVLLGALVLGYVCAGVVRARAIRLALAWLALVLSALSELVDVVVAQEPGEAAAAALLLATSAAAIAALASFHRTEWFAWQRTKPSPALGEPIGGLVAVAVLVGVLSGLTAPADDGVELRFSVAGR